MSGGPKPHVHAIDDFAARDAARLVYEHDQREEVAMAEKVRPYLHSIKDKASKGERTTRMTMTVEIAEALRDRGFTVIRGGKAIEWEVSWNLPHIPQPQGGG